MPSISERIMTHAEALPEATPLCPGALLHLGSRAAVDQALARLARTGKLLRVCRGIYMRTINTRFGVRGPCSHEGLKALSLLWGETIVPCGGAAANWLGLITQNPVRAVYITSGTNRWLHFGGSPVELRHAPRWQLVAPYSNAGDIVRALAFLGREEIEDSLEAVLPKFSENDLNELAAVRAVLPNWLAEPISAQLSNRLAEPINAQLSNG